MATTDPKGRRASVHRVLQAAICGALALTAAAAVAALPAGAANTAKTGGVLAGYDLSPHNLPDVGGTVTFTATGVRNATAGCQLRVAGVTSLVRGVTVKGVAVNGTPVHHGPRVAALDFPIAQHADCPASLTATAFIARNRGLSRAHLDFTLRLYSNAVDKSHQAVTALRTFGARSVGVAATRNVVVRNVVARPAVFTNWSGAGATGTQLQVGADVANAQTCTVTSQVVETGGTPGNAVSNLKGFEDIALTPGVPVDCAAAGTPTPAHVTADLAVPGIQLAKGATCGYVKLSVTLGAKGNGHPRAGRARVTVSSGGPHC